MHIFLAVFLANMVKTGYYGVTYFPVLDDYIQYHNYRLYQNVWQEVLLPAGTLATRPLAGLLDVYFWGHLWEHPWAVPVALSALLAGALAILGRVFSRCGAGVGRVFYILAALSPLAFESTYWLSAASRLVTGLFFTALSLWWLTDYQGSGKGRHLAAFWLCNLLSCLLYEQVAALSLALAGFVIAAGGKKRRLCLISLGNLALVGAYYLMLRGCGGNGARSAISPDIFGHIGQIGAQLRENCLAGGQLVKNSLLRGLGLAEKKLPYGVMLALMAAVPGLAGNVCPAGGRKKGVLAIVCMTAPFLPYVILDSCHISFRNLFLPLLGVALLADMLPLSRSRVFAVLLAGLCLLCNTAEVHDYRAVYLADRAICTRVVPFVGDGQAPVYLTGAKPCYVPLSAYYHEHIHNVTQSEWALTGAVRAYGKNGAIRRVVPVERGFSQFPPGAIVLEIDEAGNVTYRRRLPP